MSLGRLILRTTVGGLFIGHGTQKLFGWFDGPGLDATEQMFGAIGLRPARAHAVAAGAAEAGGGLGLVLGAATPIASATIVATMLTAIRTVHGGNGPWVTKQGWEYNAVLIGTALALAETGPGRPSIDDLRGVDRRGPGWALAALGLGVAGAAGAKLISDAMPADDAAPAAAPAAAAE